MNTDDKIRAILQMEADAVEPSAAGYDAIREGIAKRRQRTWWVRGSTFAGVGLTTAAAVVLLSSNPSPQTIESPPAASNTATATTEPSPTEPTPPGPVASPVPRPPGTPLGTIWPLTTEAELDAWLADRATYPSLATPDNSARAFLNNYLLMPQATATRRAALSDGALRYDVTYEGELVTTLEMQPFGPDGTAPYLVTRATSPKLTIATPLPNSNVTSPLRANGDFVEKVEPRVLVRLRADGPAAAPVELGDTYATTDESGTWHGELAFSTPHKVGSLMVTVPSPRGDGMHSAAAVVPFTLTPAVGTPAGDVFAGVRDQRLALFTPDGKLVRYLTDEGPGGGAYDPDVSPDGTKVAWSQGTGTCSQIAQYVSTAGGTPVVIESGEGGIFARPTWVGDGRIAYAHTVCEGTERTALRIYDLATRTSRTLAPLAGTPIALAASPDGKHLVYIVGNTLTRYELASGKTAVVPAYEGCRWRAVDVFGTSTVNQPMLMTATTCEREPGLLIDRFATNAPERERVTERKHDGVVYRVSFDAPSKSFLISHGIEDGESFVERFGVDGDLLTLRNVSYASW